MKIPVRIFIFGGIISIFFLIHASSASATVLRFLGPSQIPKGEPVLYQVVIDTEGEKINAFEGTVVIPRSVEVLAVADDDSIGGPWVQEPLYDKAKHQIRFSGVIPGGFVGSWGKIMSFTLQSTSTDPIILQTSSIAISLHDGRGTPAPAFTEPKNISVQIYPQFFNSSSAILGILVLCMVLFLVVRFRTKK